MTISPEALATVGTATKWLAGASPVVIAVWRLLSHDRTLLYALLPWLGRKVDARKFQEGLLAETQKAFAAEQKNLARQIDQLTQKLYKAAPAKRPLIARDLEDVERRQRESTIKFAALQDLKAGKHLALPDAPAHPKPPDAISGHWMDQFNELVRHRNEEWRALLLKDALVREAQLPGSISPRVLWLIGTLEPEKFEILAALLNLASTLDGQPVIPGDYVHLSTHPVPGLELSGRPISAARVALADAGLVADSDVVLGLHEEETLIASYGTKRVQVFTRDDRNLDIGGVLFTTMGNAIWSLYTATPNELGRMLFDRWVKDLRARGFTIKEI